MKQKILVVDDELNNTLLMEGILRHKYDVVIARNGQEAVDMATTEKPGIILMDITMPVMDGLSACEILNKQAATKDIPVIFITALGGMHDETKGFDVGAVDYIHKPISAPILLRRVNTHLSLVKAEKLDSLAKESIHMLGEAGHYNDTDTGVHIWRMADYSATLARAAGWDDEQCEILELAAPMHDTGKIGTPDSILKAERKLEPDEWEIMKQHSQIGHDILIRSQHNVFQMAAIIALHHHEKWNGQGYPHGLAGEEIPEAARIVAIADVFDALTMKRPYKEAWSIDKSLEYIVNESGSHFDPRLADLFIEIKDQIIDVKVHWDLIDEKTQSGFV